MAVTRRTRVAVTRFGLEAGACGVAMPVFGPGDCVEWGHFGAALGRPFEELLSWVDDDAAEPNADMWGRGGRITEKPSSAAAGAHVGRAGAVTTAVSSGAVLGMGMMAMQLPPRRPREVGLIRGCQHNPLLRLPK